MPADIQAILDTADQLEGVLERESQALEAHGVRGISEFQEQKNELTNAYMRLTKELLQASNPGLSDQQREQLKAAHESLQATTQRNARLLQAARLANQRLIELTADVVAQEQERHTGYTAKGHAYGNKGKTAQPAPKTGPVTMAVNINA